MVARLLVSTVLMCALLAGTPNGQQLLIRPKLPQQESLDLDVLPTRIAPGEPRFVSPVTEEDLTQLKAAGLDNVQPIGSQGWARAQVLHKSASLQKVIQDLTTKGFDVELDAIVTLDQQPTDLSAASRNQQVASTQQQGALTNQQVASTQQRAAVTKQQAALTDQVLSTDQQAASSDQQLVSTDEQAVSPDQQETPTDQQQAATDQQAASTDQQNGVGDGVIPDDTLWPDVQAWHTQIHAPEAWRVARETNIKVCTVDSGTQTDHPDLMGNIHEGDVFNMGDNSTASAENDERGHGTHVAGIVGSIGNNSEGTVGVAWRVPLIACRFIGKDGTGRLSQAIDCIRWCREQGAKVITNSWGYPSGGNISHALQYEIDITQSAGSLIVWSAGNYGKDLDEDTADSRPFDTHTPAVIVVGSVNPNDQQSSFSNYGKTSVHLFAPGENIMSTLPGSKYGRKSGTSMAAPMVAGAIALMWGTAPSMPAEQVKAALIDGTDVVPGAAASTSQGRLNVMKAIDALQRTAQASSSPSFRQPERDCIDQHVNCTMWLNLGYCNTSYLYRGRSVALEMCPASCGNCSSANSTFTVTPMDLSGVWATGRAHNLLIIYNHNSRSGYATWSGSPAVQALAIRNVQANIFLFQDPWGRAFLVVASAAAGHEEAEVLQILGTTYSWQRVSRDKGGLSGSRDGSTSGSTVSTNGTKGSTVSSSGTTGSTVSVPHTGTNSTAPYSGTNSTIPYNGTNSTIPYNGTNSTAPYSGTNSTVPYNGTNSTIPYNGTNSTVPYNGTNSTAPYSGTNSTIPYNGTNSTVPYNGTNSTAPYSGTNSTIPYNGTNSTISYTGTNSTVPGNASDAGSAGQGLSELPTEAQESNQHSSTEAEPPLSHGGENSSQVAPAGSTAGSTAVGGEVSVSETPGVHWPGAYDFRKLFKVLEQLGTYRHAPADRGGSAPNVTLRMIMKPAGVQQQ